jgi:transposase
MKLHVVGIDLGKTIFHLVGLDSTGKVVIRKKCSRPQLLAFTANLQMQLIGMESCSGSHFLGRALREQGHEVRLMPAQYAPRKRPTNNSIGENALEGAETIEAPNHLIAFLCNLDGDSTMNLLLGSRDPCNPGRGKWRSGRRA